MLSIAAAVGIVSVGLRIAALFASVPNCGSAGLALLGNLLALVYNPILLPLLPKLQLQLHYCKNMFICYFLLVVGFVSMLSGSVLALRLIQTIPICKPTYYRDDWL
jgi:hypothetical protein